MKQKDAKKTHMIDEKASMFHDGHRELQDRFDGRKLADALERHYRLSEFGPEQINLIETAEFFFLATAHEQSVDCSYKGGPPGFVRVTGKTTLEWPDFDGNSMYRSLGNLSRSSQAGLLFIRFGPSPTRLRVNGRCELLSSENGRLRVRLHAQEIFPNCPRYIPDLGNGVPSPYLPKGTETGAKPDWKSRPGLVEHLPEKDPHRD